MKADAHLQEKLAHRAAAVQRAHAHNAVAYPLIPNSPHWRQVIDPATNAQFDPDAVPAPADS